MQVRLPRSIIKLNELAQRWRDVSSCLINMLNGHIRVMDKLGVVEFVRAYEKLGDRLSGTLGGS